MLSWLGLWLHSRSLVCRNGPRCPFKVLTPLPRALIHPEALPLDHVLCNLGLPNHPLIQYALDLVLLIRSNLDGTGVELERIWRYMRPHPLKNLHVRCIQHRATHRSAPE